MGDRLKISRSIENWKNYGKLAKKSRRYRLNIKGKN
jgi:hypothetical protein